MAIRIHSASLHLHPLRTRIPFRYGIVTMTQVPHLMVRLEAEVDGALHVGMSAENLVPKWFTKNPDTSIEADTQQMLAVVGSACKIAQQIGEHSTVFDGWYELYEQMKRDAVQTGNPPLLWGLGLSLVERAMMDAFCRASSVSFTAAVRENRFGVDLGRLYSELAGARPADFLGNPLAQIIVRHTVGLSDPLTDAEIPPPQRIEDGLPQSLEASIAVYGLTHFKIKLAGDVNRDLDRLHQIAVVLERACPSYACTLDANENYRAVQPVQELWRSIRSDPRLKQFASRLMFIEQPLHREVALSDDVCRELLAWTDRADMIIDESGGTIDALPQALAGGYVGTSHKNCKGAFKGIAATCLVRKRQAQNPGARLVVSAEDLSNTGPIALAQDLAVVATLGIHHAERNGHHYFRGMSGWPATIQDKALATFPQLFRRHGKGFVTLRISGGKLDAGQCCDSAFGGQLMVEPRELMEFGESDQSRVT